MVPIIQFWIILSHIYKMSQNLQKLAFFNEHVLMSLNAGDFMKLQKEAKFYCEKLYFRIKHHIYTNAKQCLN